MIKPSCYIRNIKPKQLQQLEQLQAKFPTLKTVPRLLFFALYEYFDQQKEIDRLKRIIAYKQAKIERLQNAEIT
jgi:hypothetical protein